MSRLKIVLFLFKIKLNRFLKMNFRNILLVLMLVSSSYLYSQSILVSGIVVDEGGNPLPGVTVLIEGDFSFANPIGIGEAPTLILAVISEFIAPIFILIGYKTKFFSFFPAATMFVAAFIVHMGDPFGSVEKALLFLAVFVILMLTGPGKYSIDRKFS